MRPSSHLPIVAAEPRKVISVRIFRVSLEALIAFLPPESPKSTIKKEFRFVAFFEA